MRFDNDCHHQTWGCDVKNAVRYSIRLRTNLSVAKTRWQFWCERKKVSEKKQLVCKTITDLNRLHRRNASIILVRETPAEMHSDINQCRMSPLQILRRTLSWLL